MPAFKEQTDEWMDEFIGVQTVGELGLAGPPPPPPHFPNI